MIGVLCFADFQRTVGNFIAEEFEGLDFAFSVEEIGIIEDVNKALIVFIAGLDASLGLLCIVVNLPYTIGQAALDIKANQNPKMFVPKLFIDFLEAGEIEISDKKVGFIASRKDVINDFRQELFLIGYQVLAHINAAKKYVMGMFSAYRCQI